TCSCCRALLSLRIRSPPTSSLFPYTTLFRSGVLMSYDSRMSDFETFTVQEVPDDAHILDVRDPYEYDAGHIPGAVNIPLDQLPIRMDEIDPDPDYYVICRTGGRSARPTPYMEMHGYSAFNVAGGCGAWLEAEKPLISENGQDPIVR